MRRLVLLLSLVAAVAAHLPTQAHAQVTAADSAAVLLQAANRFEAAGNADVSHALLEMIVERFGATPAGATARERLASVASRGTRGSGNVELQVWTTLYGLWLGVAIPGALGADDSEPYGLGLLLGGPVGFFGGRAIAGRRDLTEGQARAITLGGLWGGWQAAGWREVFDWGVDEICEPDPFDPSRSFCFTNEGSSEEAFTAMIVGSVAGMIVGNQLSKQSISPGSATAVNFGALWGSWFGVAAGVLMDLEDDNLLAATLVGGNAGLAGMMAAAPGWEVSRSRARLVSIAGVIGGLGGAGIDLIASVDDEKTAIGIPLATSIVGLGIGIAATQDYDRDAAEPADPADDSFALLSRTGSGWSLDLPAPYPVVVERPGPRGPRLRTALGVTLFEARFR